MIRKHEIVTEAELWLLYATAARRVSESGLGELSSKYLQLSDQHRKRHDGLKAEDAE